jgi:hypothetical protein
MPLTLDFIRDPGCSGDAFNRFCQDAQTREVLYYCEANDSQLEIHRGNKYGPLVADTRSCPSQPGATDIRMLAAGNRNAHVHHDETTRRTHFTKNGRKFSWKNRSQLVDDTGAVVAQMQTFSDPEARRAGRLVINDQENRGLVEPIVMTALIVQERSEEDRSWF